MSSILEKALASLNGKDASILDASPLSIVDSWVDTGSYALNAIVSGSLYLGIPNGRICGFSGPSGCGKTLIMLKIVSKFLQQDPENHAIIFDSEVAVDKGTALALGCDVKRIKHVPVNTVMDVRNMCLKFLDTVIAGGDQLKGKFIIVIDSLGNLAADKEIADAAADKTASDMGLRAKQLKSLFRVLTYRTAKAKSSILFSNHEYDDPAAMYPSLVKNQSGGKGPVYLASLLVQLSFKREKNEKDHEQDEILEASKKVGGITMNALTLKNRFIPPMLCTSIYNNFKTGLDEYSGLFDLAKGLDVIQGDKTYTFGDKKLGYRKAFERDPEIWENLLMPELEKKLNAEFQFSQEILSDTDQS